MHACMQHLVPEEEGGDSLIVSLHQGDSLCLYLKETVVMLRRQSLSLSKGDS